MSIEDKRDKLGNVLKEICRFILRYTNLTILIQDRQLKVTYVNQQPLKKMRKYEKKELIDKSFIKYVHPEDQHRILRMYKEIKKDKQIVIPNYQYI